ncbi:hypothetical protein DFH09DRAFT_1101450 [Mycena vulgaris]|nr:hypothetical protein DFH09DRAFT_1101450 [Mycena vulgaris]
MYSSVSHYMLSIPIQKTCAPRMTRLIAPPRARRRGRNTQPLGPERGAVHGGRMRVRERVRVAPTVVRRSHVVPFPRPPSASHMHAPASASPSTSTSSSSLQRHTPHTPLSAAAPDPRRASVASFASATSVDSFATARSGAWDDEVDALGPVRGGMLNENENENEGRRAQVLDVPVPVRVSDGTGDKNAGRRTRSGGADTDMGVREREEQDGDGDGEGGGLAQVDCITTATFTLPGSATGTIQCDFGVPPTLGLLLRIPELHAAIPAPDALRSWESGPASQSGQLQMERRAAAPAPSLAAAQYGAGIGAVGTSTVVEMGGSVAARAGMRGAAEVCTSPALDPVSASESVFVFVFGAVEVEMGGRTGFGVGVGVGVGVFGVGVGAGISVELEDPELDAPTPAPGRSVSALSLPRLLRAASPAAARRGFEVGSQLRWGPTLEGWHKDASLLARTSSKWRGRGRRGDGQEAPPLCMANAPLLRMLAEGPVRSAADLAEDAERRRSGWWRPALFQHIHVHVRAPARSRTVQRSASRGVAGAADGRGADKEAPGIVASGLRVRGFRREAHVMGIEQTKYLVVVRRSFSRPTTSAYAQSVWRIAKQDVPSTALDIRCRRVTWSSLRSPRPQVVRRVQVTSSRVKMVKHVGVARTSEERFSATPTRGVHACRPDCASGSRASSAHKAYNSFARNPERFALTTGGTDQTSFPRNQATSPFSIYLKWFSRFPVRSWSPRERPRPNALYTCTSSITTICASMAWNSGTNCHALHLRAELVKAKVQAPGGSVCAGFVPVLRCARLATEYYTALHSITQQPSLYAVMHVTTTRHYTARGPLHGTTRCYAEGTPHYRTTALHSTAVVLRSAAQQPQGLVRADWTTARNACTTPQTNMLIHDTPFGHAMGTGMLQHTFTGSVVHSVAVLNGWALMHCRLASSPRTTKAPPDARSVALATQSSIGRPLELATAARDESHLLQPPHVEHTPRKGATLVRELLGTGREWERSKRPHLLHNYEEKRHQHIF